MINSIGDGRVAAQWEPSAADIGGARLPDFAAFVRLKTALSVESYRELWQWPVDDLDSFWRLMWEHFWRQR
jgi:acetoacetyl-CoA synthetase